MGNLKADPFWDKGSTGDVRCSSDAIMATKYTPLNRHNLEYNGRGMNQALPSRFGLTGVVVPRSTIFGGSLGFDPHKPRIVNIDPDIKDQCSVVDLSLLTKESMAQAYADAGDNPYAQADHLIRASQTFRNLAIGFEPVGYKKASSNTMNREPPLGKLSGYVVPRAGINGGQLQELPEEQYSEELMSPSVSPRTNNKPIFTKTNGMPDTIEVDNEERVGNTRILRPNAQTPSHKQKGFVDQTTEVQQPALKPKVVKAIPQQSMPLTPININKAMPEPPNVSVIFEMQGWGELEANYHQVIKNGNLLVLVFDTSFKAGMKFFPPASNDDQVMAVKIAGSDNVYLVHSTNSRFEHNNHEYCVLVIEDESKTEGT